MAKRRWLFRYLGVFLLICLGSISTIFSPMPCIGSERDEKLATFSLEVNHQPLGEVLQQISEATGYEITIDSEYAKLPITVSLKNVSVEEGLRRILGNASRYMVIDEAEKKISVRIVDADLSKRTAQRSQAHIDPLNPVALPPPVLPGESEISQAELQEMNKSQMNVKPPNLDYLPPPVLPGDPEISQRELEEMNKSQMNVEPPNLDYLPPPVLPGDPEISQRELEEMNKSQMNVEPPNLDYLPPPVLPGDHPE